MKGKTAPKPDYSIKQVGQRFKVYDAQSRFRVGFDTRDAADEWITGQREAAHRHPFALMGSRL